MTIKHHTNLTRDQLENNLKINQKLDATKD